MEFEQSARKAKESGRVSSKMQESKYGDQGVHTCLAHCRCSVNSKVSPHCSRDISFLPIVILGGCLKSKDGSALISPEEEIALLVLSSPHQSFPSLPGKHPGSLLKMQMKLVDGGSHL
jgi:hypothetical protein